MQTELRILAVVLLPVVGCNPALNCLAQVEVASLDDGVGLDDDAVRVVGVRVVDQKLIATHGLLVLWIVVEVEIPARTRRQWSWVELSANTSDSFGHCFLRRQMG